METQNNRNVTRAEISEKSVKDITGNVPYGTHTCLFYRKRQDLIDILPRYFKTGLENNQLCVWVVSEPLGVEDAIKSLKSVIPNTDDYIKRGLMEIIDYSQFYVQSGSFDAESVFKRWTKKEEHAIQRGLDWLRACGNIHWLEKKDWQDFMDYEAKINELIVTRKMIAICAYFVEGLTLTEILDVGIRHQTALIRQKGIWNIVRSSTYKKAHAELVNKSV